MSLVFEFCIFAMTFRSVIFYVFKFISLTYSCFFVVCLGDVFKTVKLMGIRGSKLN